MKKLLILIIMLFSFTNINADDKSSMISGTGVKIEIFEDGKMTPHKIIADFLFYQEKDKSWRGYWEHIYIAPNDDAKDVILKIERCSTDEGTIQNFQRFSDGCSFEMLVGKMFGDRKYQVVIKEDGLTPQISASALWYSELLKKELKIEWKSTDKLYFELPYNKVF